MKKTLQLKGDIECLRDYTDDTIREMIAWGWFNAISVETVMMQINDITGGQSLSDAGITEIEVMVGSDGGDLDEGYKLYHLFKSMADEGIKLKFKASGLVASAATPMMYAAGVENFEMPLGSTLLIHNPWGGIQGDAKAVRKGAEALQAAEDEMAELYSQLTGKPVDEMKALMSENKRLTSTEAQEMGLCAKRESKIAIAASFKDSKVDYKSLLKSQKEQTENELNKLATTLDEVNKFI